MASLHRLNKKSNKRNVGFSIIELLVCIGIIGILMAIFLPILSRAKETAYRTQCQANLRQIYGFFQNYRNDNRDQHPSVAPYSPTGANKTFHDWVHWQEFRQKENSPVFRYLKTFSVMVCPRDVLELHINESYCPDDGPYMYSYVINEYLGFYGDKTNRYPPKISQVKNPSQTNFIAEEDENIINDGLWFPLHDYLSTRHDNNLGRKVQQYTNGAQNLGKKTNICFLDGHIEFISKDEVMRNKYNKPANYIFR